MTARLAGVQAVDWQPELFARLPVRHAPDNARGRRAAGGGRSTQAGPMLPQLTGALSKMKAFARDRVSHVCRATVVARALGPAAARCAPFRRLAIALEPGRPNAVAPNRRPMAAIVRLHRSPRRFLRCRVSPPRSGRCLRGRATAPVRRSRGLAAPIGEVPRVLHSVGRTVRAPKFRVRRSATMCRARLRRSGGTCGAWTIAYPAMGGSSGSCRDGRRSSGGGDTPSTPPAAAGSRSTS
ncbi:hypothetical protein BTM_216 [Burkholderia thailandensis 34]|nr:hypothetical protein BTM_216 [Burkholderia thailandensis 34]